MKLEEEVCKLLLPIIKPEKVEYTIDDLGPIQSSTLNNLRYIRQDLTIQSYRILDQ
jgi:hypothetical protein